MVTSPLDAASLRERVQATVDEVLAHQATVLAEVGPDAQELLGAVGSLKGDIVAP